MRELRTSKDFVHKDSFFAFLAGTAIIGVLLGVISHCFMSDAFLKQMAIAQENFIEIRRHQDFIIILMKSFLSSTVFLGVAFVLGFSAISQPLEIILPVIKGMGLGATMAQIYAQNGKGGMFISLVIILPCAAISMYALLMGTRESVSFSNILMTDLLSSKQSGGLLPALKLYITKFVVLEAIVAVSAGADCLCTVIFSYKL